MKNPYGIVKGRSGSNPKIIVGRVMLYAVNRQLNRYGSFRFNRFANPFAIYANIDTFRNKIPVFNTNIKKMKMGSIIATLPASKSGIRLVESFSIIMELISDGTKYIQIRINTY